MSILRKAVSWGADYVYAGWRQLRGLFTRSGPNDFRSGNLAPILVIPGVYESWHFMLPLIRELHDLGYPVHVVGALRDNRLPVAVAAHIVTAYLEAHGLTNVLIVAHSKGGLIGKHVMSFGDPSRRVQQMVAIATPFGGSKYARLFLNRTLRSFSRKNETLMLLSDAQDVNARIVSIYASFDPHIPDGSELAGARNVCIDGSGHFRILRNSDARAEVVRVASENR